jgi:CheY-like chemotaxis protein
VRVTDSGVGIPADLLPSIFDMFVQERVRSDGSGGLGLGLALANQLVRMHHGSIRAASPGRGKGSTFEVQLPLATSDDVLATRRRSESIEAIPKPVIGGLLTLVVDDNDDARELLADMLKSHGYDVITAVDGREGLALIRDQRPAVALIDLGLPGLDGYTLARQLRSECPDLTTRLVALTGYGHSTDMQRTKEAGFAAHVVKPATAAMILEALTTVTA